MQEDQQQQPPNPFSGGDQMSADAFSLSQQFQQPQQSQFQMTQQSNFQAQQPQQSPKPKSAVDDLNDSIRMALGGGSPNRQAMMSPARQMTGLQFMMRLFTPLSPYHAIEFCTIIIINIQKCMLARLW